MKRLAMLLVLSPLSAFADHVNGYEKKDGTYVQPYERTRENKTRNDNYSTEGNSNPNTGKEGTKPRDEEGKSERRRY